MQNNDDFQHFQKLLTENKLEEANSFCQSWQAREPHSAIAKNCQGLVYVRLGDMKEALACFEKAIEIDPKTIAYHVNLSNAYLALGNVEKAKQHLHQALRINPEHAESYNNLGRLHYKQSLFNEAIYYFEKALRLDPDYWEAHYNLAHSFAKTNQLNRAATHYNEVLRRVPNHATAHFNLGLTYFEQGECEKARVHLKKTLELTPDNATAARFLGHTEVALGHVSEAIEAFETALKLTDTLPEIQHNLAVLYLRQEDKATALKYFEQALALDKENDTARHMILALKGNPSVQAPKNYVSELFDQYAEYYDSHVKEKLHYAVPGLLRSAVARCLDHNPRAGRVLDLGCGTGLCGIYFRDLAIELIGVDLSPKMVAKAKALGAYDEVIVADLNEYLAQKDLLPFDLIIAGDVLVYIGDLTTVFQGVSNALGKGGRFAFTTEHHEATEDQNQEYFLKPTGRFAHSRDYIHALAERYHFIIEVEESITPREHLGRAVPGDLYILRK